MQMMKQRSNVKNRHQEEPEAPKQINNNKDKGFRKGMKDKLKSSLLGTKDKKE